MSLEKYSTKRKGLLHNAGSLGVTVFHPLLYNFSSHGIGYMENTGINMIKRFIFLAICIWFLH